MKRPWLFRTIFKLLFFIPYRLIFWTKVINKKELRKHKGKGIVIVCNHKSNTDVPTMFMAIHRRLNFIAKPELFKKRLFAWFFRNLLGFPIQRGKELALMKHSLSVLRSNQSLLIFPEGMRVFNPEDSLALRNGASMIAIKGGVNVLPIVINRAPRPFRLTKIKVGGAISTEEYQNKKIEKAGLNNLSETISSTMREMLGGFEKIPKKQRWESLPVITSRAIVFRNIDGVEHLLLMRRSRPTFNNGQYYYVTPGGHLEENETPKEAVIREVIEETGLEVEPLRVLYKAPRPVEFGGKEGTLQAFFLCGYRHGEVVMNPNTDEYMEGSPGHPWYDGQCCGTYEPMWFPLSEVFSKDFDLRPHSMKVQLEKDYNKRGTRIVKPTQLLK